MTLLALIRHAPTAWNAERRLQGRADPPVSAAGRAAMAAWRVPPLLAEARWVASPLRRARDTAALLAASRAEIEPRLIEMNWGDWEGRTREELLQEFGYEAVDRNSQGRDFRPPRGETPREVWERVRPWIAEIGAAGVPVAGVTHRGLIRAVYAEATGWAMTAPAPDPIHDGAAHLFLARAEGSVGLIRMNLALA